MNSSIVERTVGLFVLGGICCLGYFAFALGARSFRPAETISVEARFNNASGLNPGSQITIAGVPVGTVGGLKLGKDFSALVELKVRKDLNLPLDTLASIRGRGLLGDKYVALTPGAEDKALSPGDRIVDTESSIDIESLLSRFAFGSMQQEKKPPTKD